jgi:hypothetical protein
MSKMTQTDRLERAETIVREYFSNRYTYAQLAERHNVALSTASNYVARSRKGLPLIAIPAGEVIDRATEQSIIDYAFSKSKPLIWQVALKFGLSNLRVSRIIKAEKLRRAAEATATKMTSPDHAGNQNGAAENVVPEGKLA